MWVFSKNQISKETVAICVSIYPFFLEKMKDEIQENKKYMQLIIKP